MNDHYIEHLHQFETYIIMASCNKLYVYFNKRN